LYGTTYASNGGYYWGSVFKVNTDGSSFRTLHTFTDGSDGANPQAGLVLSGSTLYGTTSKGGTTNYVYDPVAGRGWSGYGTLFTISTDGLNFKNLYSFTNGSWGETAYGGVILSGSTLYGTTDVGEWGSVFAINTDGSEFMTLHAFAYNDGASPTASLILSGNILYGTTEFGGSNTTWGTVFALSLAPSAPTITTQPQSQTAEAGSNVAFSVVASGSPWPNYQWQFNGQNLAGQPAASLSLINVKFANAGGYLVIVTNAYGSVTSAVAQLTVFTNLVVVQTNEPPPPPGKPTIPTDATHFKVFTNGGFVTGIGLDPSKGAIVLTHGWKDSSSNWPLEMANLIKLELGSNTPNIVAWDWRAEANDTLTSATSKTLGQGYALGTNVVAALGANYSMRIHFIGHSLGTMVNAKAANIVHSLGFSWTNTQMTLFDEASVASGLMADSWQTATTLLQNDDNPQLILQPVLPAQCAWADNYITAFGLVHASAVNVILTNLYPVIDDTVLGDIGNIIWKNFVTQDTIYHNYPHDWYFNTVNQINNPNDPPYLMGFVRSWEGGGYAGRPSANTYYIESPNCPPSFPSYSGYDPAYNLVQISSDQASQFLNDRLKTILPQHLVSAVGASENVLANAPSQAQAMLETGQILDPAADGEFLLQYDAATIVRFVTTRLGGSLVQNGPARPQGGPTPKDGGMNSPAYVWITLSVPSSAVAMSFDFMLEGAGNQDSFQAALDNQNIFTLETVLIQTNVGMNSGMIGVSQYAGQEVQLFLGIVGGTSTNVTATVGNIMFYSAAPPTLQIQLAGTNIVLSWPLWAANYSLETKDKLGTANSWAVVTSVPSIVNSECTVTNQISRGSAFYRLAIIPPPVLHAQISGSSFVLSWPASGQNSSLQTTTNLTDANSWTTVTNVPAVLNQQNVVTNAMSGRMRFYRLKMQ
jgi:pimeloyl-ACP methyl ester carboxylesterase